MDEDGKSDPEVVNFMKKVKKFWQTSVETRPSLFSAVEPADVHRLWTTVTSLGGFEEVSKETQWSVVAQLLGREDNDGGNYWKSFYQNVLLPIERSQESSGLQWELDSTQSPGAVDPINSTWTLNASKKVQASVRSGAVKLARLRKASVVRQKRLLKTQSEQRALAVRLRALSQQQQDDGGLVSKVVASGKGTLAFAQLGGPADVSSGNAGNKAPLLNLSSIKGGSPLAAVASLRGPIVEPEPASPAESNEWVEEGEDETWRRGKRSKKQGVESLPLEAKRERLGQPGQDYRYWIDDLAEIERCLPLKERHRAQEAQVWVQGTCLATSNGEPFNSAIQAASRHLRLRRLLLAGVEGRRLPALELAEAWVRQEVEEYGRLRACLFVESRNSTWRDHGLKLGCKSQSQLEGGALDDERKNKGDWEEEDEELEQELLKRETGWLRPCGLCGGEHNLGPMCATWRLIEMDLRFAALRSESRGSPHRDSLQGGILSDGLCVDDLHEAEDEEEVENLSISLSHGKRRRGGDGPASQGQSEMKGPSPAKQSSASRADTWRHEAALTLLPICEKVEAAWMPSFLCNFPGCKLGIPGRGVSHKDLVVHWPSHSPQRQGTKTPELPGGNDGAPAPWRPPLFGELSHWRVEEEDWRWAHSLSEGMLRLLVDIQLLIGEVRLMASPMGQMELLTPRSLRAIGILLEEFIKERMTFSSDFLQ